jgi:hypothetical protein
MAKVMDRYEFAAKRYDLMIKAMERAQELDQPEWYTAFALLSIACTVDEIESVLDTK